MDQLRVGSPGAVTTYDVEGLRTRVSISASRGRSDDEVTITGRLRTMTGDPMPHATMILERREPGQSATGSRCSSPTSGTAVCGPPWRPMSARSTAGGSSSGRWPRATPRWPCCSTSCRRCRPSPPSSTPRRRRRRRTPSPTSPTTSHRRDPSDALDPSSTGSTRGAGQRAGQRVGHRVSQRLSLERRSASRRHSSTASRRRTRPRASGSPQRPRPGRPERFQRPAAARVPSPAVACPSGLRSTPRKRVWVQAHRGFKSHRHRQAIAPDHVVVRGVLVGQASRAKPRASGRSETVGLRLGGVLVPHDALATGRADGEDGDAAAEDDEGEGQAGGAGRVGGGDRERRRVRVNARGGARRRRRAAPARSSP